MRPTEGFFHGPIKANQPWSNYNSKKHDVRETAVKVLFKIVQEGSVRSGLPKVGLAGKSWPTMTFNLVCQMFLMKINKM